MMYDPSMSPAPDQKETRLGFILMAATLLVVPTALYLLNSLLPKPLSDGMLNTVFYVINFVLTILIFRNFLKNALQTAISRLFPVIWYAILGYLGHQALSNLLGMGIYAIYPDFSNINDESIFAMLGDDLVPLAMATVFLVPLAEETLYRGLLFHKIYEKKPILGYLASMLGFAAIHVVGYIGAQPPLVLFLCFLQYLPAGYCLCWCYRRTGTIICPVLMHAIVNASSILYYLR